MNVGQRLAQLSGLSGVSALAHLLGITTGSSPGEPVLVLADTFFVAVDEQSAVVAKTITAEARAAVAEPERLSVTPLKEVYIFMAPERVVLTTPDTTWTIVEVTA